MKLAKLSLAAIVAVGAMTTFASAASLEEAIKGVELNGYLRYRFTSNDEANGHTDEHAFKGLTEFVMPVADNLKAGMTLAVSGTDDAADGKASDTSDKLTLNLDKLWFQYAMDGFSLKAGKMEVFSPWTDPGQNGTVGDGALALYTGVPGWTLGLGGFVATNIDGMEEEDLYAAGALGSVGPVNLQLWASTLSNVFDYAVFAQAGFEMAGFNARVQANQLELESGVDGLYWGIEAGYGMAGFKANVGYTQNDKDQGIYSLAGSDASGFIFSGGKQINGKIANVADMQAFFIDLDYATGPYSVGAGYAHGEVDAYDLDEFYVEAGYKYAKNFKLSTYFSSFERDNKVGADAENDRIRFEAKYSF